VKRDSFVHEFVESIPSQLAEGTLYVCILYRTSVHLCACGCGSKAVTPLRPGRWHMIFDGDSVSLWPSVGSWQFKCRSHYFIESDRVRWCAPWTDTQIAAGRERDTFDMRKYYASRAAATIDQTPHAPFDLDEAKGVYARAWRRASRAVKRLIP
jgi:hypothetical protein